jgi:hypothetical protein
MKVAARKVSHRPTEGLGLIGRELIRLAELEEGARRIRPGFDHRKRLDPEASRARLDLGQELPPALGIRQERRQVLIGPIRVPMARLQG